MNRGDERTGGPSPQQQLRSPTHRIRRPRKDKDGGSGTDLPKNSVSSEQVKEDKPAPKVPTQEDFKRYEGYAGQKWTGVCKWFNVSKGFGFVLPDFEEAKEREDDVFVHQSALQMPGFRSIGEGEAIQFTVKIGKRGLEADAVTGIAGAEIQGHTIRPMGRNKDAKIRCYNCGKLSNHKASKCREPAGSSTEKVCYHCHSTEHLLSKCPTYKRSADRRFSKPKRNPTAKAEGHSQPKEATAQSQK